MQLVGIQIYNLDIARIKKQYKEMKIMYRRLLFSGMWCSVIMLISTDVSEEPAAVIFSAEEAT